MKKWMSRKLFAAVGGVVVTLIVNYTSIPEEQAQQLTNAVLSIVGIYVGGQSLVDFGGDLLSKKNK